MPSIVFHSLLILLIVVSCLFYGSVTVFAQAIVQTISALLAFLWVLEMLRQRKFSFLKTGLIGILLLLVALVVLQLVPLPAGLVRILSPHALLFHKQFSPDAAARFITLSINPDATLGELLGLCSYIMVFVVTMHTVETKKQFNLLINLLIFFGAAISLFGIVQRYCFSETIYWFDPSASSHAVFGPFVNRNNFSGYINMLIPLALGYCLTNMTLARRLLYYCCLGLMCLGLFLSLSRGGIIIFCFSLLVFFVLAKSKGSLRSRKMKIFMYLFVAIALGLFVFESRAVLERLSTLYNRNLFLMFGHGYSWLDIVRIWMDFPLVGTGLGTFGSISSMYKTSLAQVLYTYAHNDALQLVSEVGLAGVAVVVLFFYMFFHGIIQEWLGRHSSYASGVVLGGLVSIISALAYSFLDFNLHVPSNAVLFFFIMGLVCRLVYSRFKDELSVSG